MADKLGIYNQCLTELEERSLASLNDANGGEAKRLMDRHWDAAVRKVLEAGGWNFALRTIKIEPDPDITTAFGYRYAFTKPEDWLRTQVISLEEYLRQATTRYLDHGGNWYSDDTPIYVRYVSNGDSFGMNIGAWPQYFADAVSFELATRVARKVTTSEDTRINVEKKARRSLYEALSFDAANQPSDPLPVSSWVRSRAGRTGLYYRGSRY